MILPAFLRQCNLLTWYFLGLLHESAGEHQQPGPVEEAYEPESVSPVLSPDFPKVLGTTKFLEILGGNGLKLFNQAEHPDDFLSLLGTKSFEELLNGTMTGLGPVEANLTHLGRLTQV